MLKPIKTDKLYILIMEQIKNLINEENLKPGDKLPPEREIAASLSVSRASVRQAISILAERGLLTVQQGSGAYIADPKGVPHLVEELSASLAVQQISPTDIAAARYLLECETARLCALNADEACCDKLLSLLDRRRIAENRAASYEDMNHDLHLAIAEGCGNKVYQILMGNLLELMRNNMWRFAKEKSTSRLEVLNLHLDQHEALVDAICRHDSELAKKIMSEHLSDIGDEMSFLFGD
jgi:DNA-binding FadR family transcriptional regulator